MGLFGNGRLFILFYIKSTAIERAFDIQLLWRIMNNVALSSFIIVTESKDKMSGSNFRYTFRGERMTDGWIDNFRCQGSALFNNTARKIKSLKSMTKINEDPGAKIKWNLQHHLSFFHLYPLSSHRLADKALTVLLANLVHYKNINLKMQHHTHIDTHLRMDT